MSLLGFDALGRLALGQIPAALTDIITNEDSWHVPFPDRIRKRRPMHTGSQQFASYVQIAPFSERVLADKWFTPFSEPVRTRRGVGRRKSMHTGAQQFAAYVQIAPFNERVLADKWFTPFSEPTRFRRRMPTAHQWFGRGIEFPLTGAVRSMNVLFLGSSSITGVPTSNYKQILNPSNRRRLIYAAELSPWTISQ